MSWYFSNATGGFYNDDHDFHATAEQRPADAQRVSDKVRTAMLTASSEGRGISLDAKGKPVYAEHSASEEQRLEVKRQSAQMMLAESTDRMMVHYEKDERPDAKLVAYRQGLRAFIEGKADELPTRPW